MTTERFDTIIIGGGQAGLAAGYHLRKRGLSFVILEGNDRVGDSWRKRWDSLRLFTPARFSKLPGMPLPCPKYSFPTKDEMGDYLESYAQRFDLPVRTGVRIDSVTRDGEGYVLHSRNKRFRADNIIVASGAMQTPKVPSFAPDLDPSIEQLHSSSYRSPELLADGPVLIVGCGNSGAEIAADVIGTHPTYLSGKPSAELPFKHGPAMGRFVFPVIRFIGHNVLNLSTPIGRKVRPKFIAHAAPLVRAKTKDLAAAGVELVERTDGVRRGKPVLADGRVLDVANVIWCTGFRHVFDWIDVPEALDDRGAPVEVRGISQTSPGLYFVGVAYQYAASSEAIPGMGRDAEHVVKHIASRTRKRRPAKVGAAA